MTFGTPRLLGSFWTLGVGADPLGDQRCLHDFRLRVEIAARAGFTAMGFWHADILEIRRNYSFREMKRHPGWQRHQHVEVEWLLDWYLQRARRARRRTRPGNCCSRRPKRWVPAHQDRPISATIAPTCRR